MRPATLELHAYVGEPRVYRLTLTEADEVTPLVLSGEWAAQARRHPAAPDPVDIDVDASEMAEGRLTLTIPGADLPNRSARLVYDLEGETWGTVLAGPLIVSPEVTRVGETTGGSITDLVIALGPDEVRVVSSASLGPQGEPGIGVPDPSAEPDDRWLTTADGALVYTDAPSGGKALLAAASHAPSTAVQYDTISASFVDVDAANLAVTFTPPASGRVLVRLSAWAWSSTSSARHFWGVRQGSSAVAGSLMRASDRSDLGMPMSRSAVISGLTPGEPVTWKWAFAGNGTNTARIIAGGGSTPGADAYGPATMEVWAA